MKEEDPIYLYFLTALKHEVKSNWHRQQGALADEAGISGAFLSDIIKKRTEPSFSNKKALAKACGYEYEQFLEYGRNLKDGKSAPTTTSLIDHKDRYFHAAFVHCANEKNGYGGQTIIAQEMGVSLQYINQIVKKKKKPGFKSQVKLAEACGYKLEEFLQLGKDVLSKEKPTNLPEKKEKPISKSVKKGLSTWGIRQMSCCRS